MTFEEDIQDEVITKAAIKYVMRYSSHHLAQEDIDRWMHGEQPIVSYKLGERIVA